MKYKTFVLLAALSVCVLGRCTFFGLKPLDAVAGREAGYLLATAAYRGWYTGGELYSGVKPLNIELSEAASLPGNTAVIYLLTPMFAGIDNGKFYERSAVSACEDQIFRNSLAVTFSIFSSGELLPGHATMANAAVAAAATAAACGNMEAGEYVDLGPLPIAY